MFIPYNIVKRDYVLMQNNSTKFIFPITGLTIDDELTIGDVSFYNLSNLDYKKHQHIKMFAEKMSHMSEAKTIVYVDISNVAHIWKEKCNNNLSIALMLTKQAIGLLYLTFYECKGFEDQRRRIIISANNRHECEEGMDIYLSDSTNNFRNVSDNLWLVPNEHFFNKLNSRVGYFLNLYKMDTNMKLKILKLFESLYYLCSEIHAIERILKMSAFFQLIFLKNCDESFPPASKRIRDLLSQKGIEINKLGHTGKLNKILNNIYDNIRNTYSHGIINLYEEYNVINAPDYFIYFQVYMNILLILAYSTDLEKIQTTEDLLNKLQDYRV